MINDRKLNADRHVIHRIASTRGIKYDRIELIDLDADGDLDVLTCEENEGSNNEGLGVVWYENPLVRETAVADQTDVTGPDAAQPDRSDASAPNDTLDEILEGRELTALFETIFDDSLKMIHESELFKGGTRVRRPADDVDWVLEGPG